MDYEVAAKAMYFGIALFMMYPIFIIIAGILLFYIIYNRVKDKKKETFEKRDN